MLMINTMWVLCYWICLKFVRPFAADAILDFVWTLLGGMKIPKVASVLPLQARLFAWKSLE
jgi:hypothetical protein